VDRLKKIPALIKLQIERMRARFGVFDIAMRTFKRFSEADGGSYAAALTYYTFFSVFPLLLFAASILGYLTFGNEELQADILAAGIDAVPLLGNVLTEDGLAIIQDRRGSFAVSGALLALYAGTGAIIALERALNRFQGITNEPNFFVKRLRSLKFLAVFGAGAVLSMALGAAAGYAATVAAPTGRLIAGAVGWTLAHAFGFVVGVGIFSAAYKLLPVGNRSWKEVLPGAIAAALLFEVLKEFGTIYLEQGSSRRQATFGAFALAAGLLVASYLIAQITLLGAQLNGVLTERRITRRPNATKA
jgi:inner membrane protein YhjD